MNNIDIYIKELMNIIYDISTHVKKFPINILSIIYTIYKYHNIFLHKKLYKFNEKKIIE